MPRTPSGKYDLPEGQPVAPDTIIYSSVHNVFASDVEMALTDSLSRNGYGGMLVPFRVIDGTVENPAMAFTSDNQTGMSFNSSTRVLQFSVNRILSLSAMVDGTETAGTHTAEKLRAKSNATATLASTSHGLQIALSNENHLKLGSDGIQAMNAGGNGEVLNLNKSGGAVLVNGIEIGHDNYKKDEFINVSHGTADAGKPIVLDAHGRMSVTMCQCDALTFAGTWTPATGAEYPDQTGHDNGDFWIISGLASPYTFDAGDLAGEIVSNGDTMIMSLDGWQLSSTVIDQNAYYLLDGSSAITAPFAGGGQQMKNVAPGTDDNDVVIMSQLGGQGVFLPIDGKAADSQLLDGIDSAGFALASHNHDSTYYTKSNFITFSSGSADAGKQVTLNSQGVLDPSFVSSNPFYFVGGFTPATGAEYPDTSGELTGAFWSVEGLTAPYTFTAGDLIGKETNNGDFMVWGTTGWALKESTIDPEMYYKLDGTNGITADFAGAGFKIANIADGVADNDAASVSQVNAKGDFFADGSVAMTGSLDAGGFLIENVADGAADTDAATVAQVNAKGDLKSDGTVPMVADFDAGGFKLTNLADGTDPSDAATVGQIPDSADKFIENVVTAVSASGVTTLDLALATTFTSVLTENTTFAVTNFPPAGKTVGVTLKITQDSGGSGFTVGFPVGSRFQDSTLPTLTPDADATDVFTLVLSDNSDIPDVYVAGLNMGVPA